MYSRSRAVGGPEALDRATLAENASVCPRTLAPEPVRASDNKDVVFKSNGQERFRLLANGDIKFAGLGDGWLKSSGDVISGFNPADPDQLGQVEAGPFWKTTGNLMAETQPNPPDRFLGTKDAVDLGVRTNNIERLKIGGTDGTISVNGGALTYAQLGGSLLIMKQGWSDWLTLQNNANGIWKFHNEEAQDGLNIFYTDANGEGPGGGLKLWNNGKVSIGIGDPIKVATDYDYGLYLWKGLLTEKVKVAVKTTNDWSDHVFEPNYALMPLEDVAQFIEKNGHLPNVPSADCMVEQGLDVVATDAMLMEKIEELTLHMIEVNKRIRLLEEENAQLKARSYR